MSTRGKHLASTRGSTHHCSHSSRHHRTQSSRGERAPSAHPAQDFQQSVSSAAGSYFSTVVVTPGLPHDQQHGTRSSTSTRPCLRLELLVREADACVQHIPAAGTQGWFPRLLLSVGGASACSAATDHGCMRTLPWMGCSPNRRHSHIHAGAHGVVVVQVVQRQLALWMEGTWGDSCEHIGSAKPRRSSQALQHAS